MKACTHGFPKPSNCVECMYEGNLEPAGPPPAPTVERTMRAKFDGHCTFCDLGIHAGQRIALLTDGSYQHADCAAGPDEPDPTQSRDPCPLGCGRTTDDPAGGPCSTCLDLIHDDLEADDV